MFCSFIFKPIPDKNGNLKCPDCELTELKASIDRRIKKLYPNLFKAINTKFVIDPYQEGPDAGGNDMGFIEGPQNPYHDRT